MSSIEYIGKFLNYDIENNILQIQLEFITPEEQDKLEKSVLENQEHKFKHKVSNTSFVSTRQRRCWYGSLRTIILEADLLPTSERMKYFNIDMRKCHFPAEDIIFEDFDVFNEDPILEPKEMKDMTHEEMGNAIGSLHAMYDNIDWSKYRDII